MTPLVKADNLGKDYGRGQGVFGLSFELRQGEILGLLGVNGAGKSTTMDMLSGNLVPSSGRIHINGIDLAERPKQAKRALGYLPEQPPLYHKLTVDEYLDYCVRLHGLSRTETRQAIDEAKARCNLRDVGRRLIGQLSKGYRQRVGIAQAILHKPRVVIFDEPTVGLDPVQIQEIRSLIKELGRDNGVILSTHLLPEVQTLCNRVLILHEGRLVHARDGNAWQADQAQEVVVGFDSAPGAAALAAVEGVGTVTQLPDGQYRIRANDTPSALLARLSYTGWGLNQFAPQGMNLEQIFTSVVSGEQPS